MFLASDRQPLHAATDNGSVKTAKTTLNGSFKVVFATPDRSKAELSGGQTPIRCAIVVSLVLHKSWQRIGENREPLQRNDSRFLDAFSE